MLIEGEPGIGKTALARAALAGAAARQRPGLLGRRRRARPGTAAAAVPRRAPGPPAVRERAAGHDRRAAARRGSHRSRHRRAGDDRRAAHRADHRRDRGATRGARHRRPSVGRPGHRAAVGTPRQDRAPGAAAADRPDQAGRAPGGPARAAPRGRRGPPWSSSPRCPSPPPRNSSRTLAGGRPDAALLELAAGAAGNPLYLTELLAALSRSGGITVTAGGAAQLATGCVPDSLPAAIAHRLGFVTGPTKEVLRAAALLGVEFAVPDLTTVLGRSVADLVPALEEARATGVLTDVRGGLAFRHPLIREALYADLPAAVRGEWHRDAGHALATAGAPPDRVARQLLRAISGKAGGGSGPDPLAGMAPASGSGSVPQGDQELPAGPGQLDWSGGQRRHGRRVHRSGHQLRTPADRSRRGPDARSPWTPGCSSGWSRRRNRWSGRRQEWPQNCSARR